MTGYFIWGILCTLCICEGLLLEFLMLETNHINRFWNTSGLITLAGGVISMCFLFYCMGH